MRVCCLRNDRSRLNVPVSGYLTTDSGLVCILKLHHVFFVTADISVYADTGFQVLDKFQFCIAAEYVPLIRFVLVDLIEQGERVFVECRGQIGRTCNVPCAERPVRTFVILEVFQIYVCMPPLFVRVEGVS